jgi:2-amino-4-hydroxy-6-hydroxymethyldihydropteridine diphosphokinase
MYHYLLSLGSNVNPENNILKSHYYIEKLIGGIISESSLYESKAEGFESDYAFVNQSIIVKSLLNPDEVLIQISSIDQTFQRSRSTSGYSDRTIDIDIILSDNEFTNITAKIPHPRWQQRNFVIVPSQELNSELFAKQLNHTHININQVLKKFL